MFTIPGKMGLSTSKNVFVYVRSYTTSSELIKLDGIYKKFHHIKKA